MKRIHFLLISFIIFLTSISLSAHDSMKKSSIDVVKLFLSHLQSNKIFSHDEYNEYFDDANYIEKTLYIRTGIMKKNGKWNNNSSISPEKSLMGKLLMDNKELFSCPFRHTEFLVFPSAANRKEIYVSVISYAPYSQWINSLSGETTTKTMLFCLRNDSEGRPRIDLSESTIAGKNILFLLGFIARKYGDNVLIYFPEEKLKELLRSFSNISE